MGVFGWNVLSDRVVLVGVVTSHGYSGGVIGDGDWKLMVDPDGGCKHLLVNSAGKTNENGHIECEVEPTDSIGAESFEQACFTSLLGRAVNMEGPWVEDLSHSDKTEIHPIFSIMSPIAFNPPGPPAWRWELFAFSDDSGNVPAHVPFSGQSIPAHFYFNYPSTPPAPENKPYLEFIFETNLAASVSAKVADAPNGYVLLIDVMTGTAPQRGFYHGIIEYGFSGPISEECPKLKTQLSNLEQSIAARAATIQQEHAKGFKPTEEEAQEIDDLQRQRKALKQKIADLHCDRVFPPICNASDECTQLKGQIAGVQQTILTKGEHNAGEHAKGFKPTPEEVDEMENLQKKLRDLRKKAAQLGCCE
jgi:hypothetical protein